MIKWMALIAALLLPGTASAAEPVAFPHWPSDRLREARATAPQQALVFDLVREVRPKKGSARETRETVILASDFTAILTDDGGRIEDHRLCRSLGWRGQQPLSNDSCFMLPGFKYFEHANRRRLGEVLHKAGFGSGEAAETLKPYWHEAELGYQPQRSDPLAATAGDGETLFRFEGQQVARLSFSADALQPDEMRRLARWMARGEPIHPQIREAIGRQLTMPSLIRVERRMPDEQLTIRIANVRREMRAYPLPTGLQSAHAAGTGDGKRSPAFNAGIAAAIHAAEGGREAPTRAWMLSALGRDTQGGKGLEAGLWAMLLIQQYGAPHDADLAAIRSALQLAQQDRRFGALWTASALAGNASAPGDRRAAARALTGLDLGGHPYAAFRELTFANLVSVSPGSDQWDRSIFDPFDVAGDLANVYWRAIAGYPFAANAYKDLGDYYLRGFEPAPAWLAFDLGRAVDPNWASGLMGRIGAFEDQLQKTQPEMF